MILLQVKKLVFLDVPPFKTKKYLGGITYLTLLGDLCPSWPIRCKAKNQLRLVSRIFPQLNVVCISNGFTCSFCLKLYNDWQFDWTVWLLNFLDLKQPCNSEALFFKFSIRLFYCEFFICSNDRFSPPWVHGMSFISCSWFSLVRFISSIWSLPWWPSHINKKLYLCKKG